MGVYSMDILTSFTEHKGPWTCLAAYDDSTSWVIDIRSQRDKTLLIKNSGSATLTFTILASIDSSHEEDGHDPEFDIIHLGDTTVAAGAQSLQKFSDYYSFIKIQVKGAGGIATIKAAGFGN